MKARISLILTLALLGGVLLAACGGGAPASTEISIDGEDILFGAASLSVQAGQTVNLTFNNVGALEHSFVIDELGVDTGNVAAGGSASVSFTADAAGTYEYYCSVPGHREAGMVGTLTVSGG